MTIRVLRGHCVDVLGEMGAGSVHGLCTSPPYFRARRYNCPPQVWPDPEGTPPCAEGAHEWIGYVQPGVSGGRNSAKPAIKGTENFQITGDSAADVCDRCNAWRGELGWESTVALYIAHLVQVFRAARRVLRDDGQLWVNIAGGYANESGGQNGGSGNGLDYGAGRISPKAMEANRQAGRTDKTGGLPTLNWIDVPGLLGAVMQEPWRACLTCGTEAHTSCWGQIVEPQTGATLFVCPRCRVVRLHRITEKGWIWRSYVHLIKRSPLPESVQGWRWERCRVKEGGQRTAPPEHQKGAAYEKPQGATTYVPGSGGSSFDSHAQWADCPGCPKCEKTDNLVLRRGAWRPTRATEALLLFVKGDRYWSDAEAVRVPNSAGAVARFGQNGAMSPARKYPRGTEGGQAAGLREEWRGNGRNAWDWMDWPQETMARLRSDLTPEQRAYVLQRMLGADWHSSDGSDSSSTGPTNAST